MSEEKTVKMVKVEVLCDSLVYRGLYYEKARDPKKKAPNSPRKALGPYIDAFPEDDAILHEKRGNLRIVRETAAKAVGATVAGGDKDKEKGNPKKGDK